MRVSVRSIYGENLVMRPGLIRGNAELLGASVLVKG